MIIFQNNGHGYCDYHGDQCNSMPSKRRGTTTRSLPVPTPKTEVPAFFHLRRFRGTFSPIVAMPLRKSRLRHLLECDSFYKTEGVGTGGEEKERSWSSALRCMGRMARRLRTLCRMEF